MATRDPSPGPELPAEGPRTDHADYSQRARGGRWRRLLAGGRDDEFSDYGPPLTREQREHLARATDELMKRYSISRPGGAAGSEESEEDQPVSADEFGAVLETVLAEAFDFGWFDRPDLPEAPELTLESSTGELTRKALADGMVAREEEPLTWSGQDPESEVGGHLESTLSWAAGLDAHRELEPEVSPPSEPGVVAEPEQFGAAKQELETAEFEVAELMVAELREVLHEAVAAEREAILFAAVTRQRLAEARKILAALG